MNWLEVCVHWYFIYSKTLFLHLPICSYSFSNHYSRPTISQAPCLYIYQGDRWGYNSDQLFGDKCYEVYPNIWLYTRHCHAVPTVNTHHKTELATVIFPFYSWSVWGQERWGICDKDHSLESVWVGVRSRFWVPGTLLNTLCLPGCRGLGGDFVVVKAEPGRESPVSEGEAGQRRVPTGKRWGTARAGKDTQVTPGLGFFLRQVTDHEFEDSLVVQGTLHSFCELHGSHEPLFM